ncbi:MAG: choice-of-anchor B family protein [Candidatus Krumholzibacteria bacterium]|nr:choice-of-anchor B family protein [Candidatus Krumholzibacteria bacterium]
MQTFHRLLVVAGVVAFHAIVVRPVLADGTVSLLGQYALEHPGSVTDVWGYVDGNTNKEYALVGDQFGTSGVAIIDVTNPTNPTHVAQAMGVAGFDMKVWDHYLYVVHGNRGPGGRIFDLADVLAPEPVGDFESSHNLFIDDGGYMYLSMAGAPRELRGYNLNANPTSPLLIWQDGLDGPHDAAVIGTILYDFHGYLGTRIYDVTDPFSPTLLGVASDATFHHSGYPTEDGKHLFVTHERATGSDPDITVWNIEDPAAAVKVGDIFDTDATAHNLYIVGDFAYVAYYTAGFRVYDVSDPTQPAFVDGFDTSVRSGEGWEGSFGVYPFGPSGNIYVSDIDNGLYVFSFSGATKAVMIVSFEANYSGGVVALEWQVPSADGLQGFHIYRSPGDHEDYRRLNQTLIPPHLGYHYQDADVEPGKSYWYRVGAVNNGGESLSQPRMVAIPQRKFVLYQNVPNPFNPATTITYDIPRDGRVKLLVYNSLGQRVRTLVDDFQTVGPHTVVWDGRNDDERRLATGVYFMRLLVSGRVDSRRAVLLK